MPTTKAAAVGAHKVERRSEEQMEMISSFKPPEFISPYPSKINQHAETAVAEAWQWAYKHSLDSLYSAGTVQNFIDANVPTMPPQVYIDTGEKELAWICKFFNWGVVFDDQLDDAAYFQLCPEKLALLLVDLNLVFVWSFPDDPTLRGNLTHFLDSVPETRREATLQYVDAKLKEARKSPGTVYDTLKSGPLCTSLGDLWTTLVETKCPGFNLRWALACQRFLMGSMHDYVIRKQQRVPSIAEYIPLRRNSSAMDPLTVIIEYLYDVDVPDELFRTPEMQDFLTSVNDVSAWHNDLFSFKKEAFRGDVLNLVYLVSLERECTYTEAAKIVLQMVLDRIADLERASHALLKTTPPQHKQAISQYVTNCRNFISAFQDYYSSNSKRYDVPSRRPIDSPGCLASLHKGSQS